jgi:hypothetical protein
MKRVEPSSFTRKLDAGSGSRALLAEPRRNIAHLRGHLIYIWFSDDAGHIGVPHRKPEQVREVVQALRAYSSYRGGRQRG